MDPFISCGLLLEFFCDLCFGFVDGIPLILVWVCFMAMQIEQPFPKKKLL
jgi:hypothetical protein